MKRIVIFVSWCLLVGGVGQIGMESLQRYEFGRSGIAWSSLNTKLRNPLQRERDDAEQMLVTVLVSRESTVDARIMACRGLRQVGGKIGIQNLLAVLRDRRLSQEACLALQEKDSDDINPALREALPLVENSLKPQIIVTLGRRRDALAVPGIVEMAQAIPDQAIKRAAIRALGHIGGRDAISALSVLSLDAPLEKIRSHAVLSAASRALSMTPSDRDAGMAALRRLALDPSRKVVRLAAIYEWALYEKGQRAALCRQALESRRDGLLEIAPRLFALLELEEKRALYGDFFNGVSRAAQTLLVELWDPDFRNEDKLRAISLDITSDEGLRSASIRALARIHE